jgi:hypothetical protein
MKTIKSTINLIVDFGCSMDYEFIFTRNKQIGEVSNE